MINGNVGARQKAPLLVRAAIYGVGDQVLADAAVVEKRRALARRAVPRNRFALPGRVQQKFQQRQLGVLHLLRKGPVPVEGRQAGGLLHGD
jgi:hypothetical protein